VNPKSAAGAPPFPPGEGGLFRHDRLEVDVGLSGPTAAVVGQLLRQLGESTQVMCVTHQPQVAGCGHPHVFVCKETDGEMT
ncbi:hypothetical protein, partial [Klebsiella pneumoniae]|uniref:hypothetical protein n=1 Tax=Klebsiella pneumoniae TaxID=573 RepID=UPI00273082FA